MLRLSHTAVFIGAFSACEDGKRGACDSRTCMLCPMSSVNMIRALSQPYASVVMRPTRLFLMLVGGSRKEFADFVGYHQVYACYWSTVDQIMYLCDAARPLSTPANDVFLRPKREAARAQFAPMYEKFKERMRVDLETRAASHPVGRRRLLNSLERVIIEGLAVLHRHGGSGTNGLDAVSLQRTYDRARTRDPVTGCAAAAHKNPDFGAVSANVARFNAAWQAKQAELGVLVSREGAGTRTDT